MIGALLLALDDGIDREERKTAPVDAGLGEQRHIGRRRAERPLALGSPEAACKPLASLNLVLVPGAGSRTASKAIFVPCGALAEPPRRRDLAARRHPLRCQPSGPFPISPPARKILSTSARFIRRGSMARISPDSALPLCRARLPQPPLPLTWRLPYSRTMPKGPFMSRSGMSRFGFRTLRP